ncbi:MAG: hypothetical protein IIX36_02850 [Clostridia bacterium]|nr:hypothetical protein [Clostridia bacterium]
MKNKRWLRSVAFVLLFAVALGGVMQCYGLPRTYDTKNIMAVENLEKNSLDGMIIGTSVVAYSWNTPLLWRDYGLAVCHTATSIQAFGAIPGIIDYVKKNHDIKYAVVDIHGLRKSAVMGSLEEVRFRSAYLNIPDIISQYKILDDLLDFAKSAYKTYGEPEKDRDKYVDVEDKSYYLPLLSFHSRWVEGLDKNDFVTPVSKYLGAVDKSVVFEVKDCTKYLDRLNFDAPGEINDFQKEQLENLFRYGEENNIKLVFISLPSFQAKEEQQEMAGLLKYCADRGYDTIDFGTKEMIEKLGISVADDFCNTGHLNSKGGLKSTRYIGEYLVEKGYYTPDHRGEEKYSSWDSATEAYFKLYDKKWS